MQTLAVGLDYIDLNFLGAPEIIATAVLHGSAGVALIDPGPSTTHGNLRYKVVKTLIVKPSDLWVLDAIPNVNLTLITCYPFYYVGHAPRRFIVQAQKL